MLASVFPFTTHDVACATCLCLPHRRSFLLDESLAWLKPTVAFQLGDTFFLLICLLDQDTIPCVLEQYLSDFAWAGKNPIYLFFNHEGAQSWPLDIPKLRLVRASSALGTCQCPTCWQIACPRIFLPRTLLMRLLLHVPLPICVPKNTRSDVGVFSLPTCATYLLILFLCVWLIHKASCSQILARIQTIFT